jgi:hypothetical protein
MTLSLLVHAFPVCQCSPSGMSLLGRMMSDQLRRSLVALATPNLMSAGPSSSVDMLLAARMNALTTSSRRRYDFFGRGTPLDSTACTRSASERCRPLSSSFSWASRRSEYLDSSVARTASSKLDRPGRCGLRRPAAASSTSSPVSAVVNSGRPRRPASSSNSSGRYRRRRRAKSLSSLEAPSVICRFCSRTLPRTH